MILYVIYVILFTVFFLKLNPPEHINMTHIVINVKNSLPSVVTQDTANLEDFQIARHPGVIKHFENLYSTYKYLNPPENITCYICTGDWGEGDPRLLSFCGHNSIPCFGFIHWNGKLPPFKEIYEWEPIEFDKKIDKLFWIGGFSHENRKLIVEKYQDYKDFELLKWPENHRHLEDHRNYKYLLEIEGQGYSARLKVFYLLGCCVFLTDRPHVEYWHSEFKPWIHYVPIKRDGSDLIEKYEYMKQNQELTRKISEESRKKALEVFKEENIYIHMNNVLHRYKNMI